MGVSVRVSRNARVSMPFWLAVPLYLAAAAGWLVYYLAIGIWWLVMAAARALKSRAASPSR